MTKVREVQLDYQNYITYTPASPQELFSQACSNDKGTVESWRSIWLKQMAQNKSTFGSFTEKTIGKFWGHLKLKPCIIAGSGPSLKRSLEGLKERAGISLISCLHNFHYFEDNDIHPEFYVTLDAGHLPIEEVSEGGKRSEEEYWSLTENRVLLAHVATHPMLLEKWKGEIYFFQSPLPDLELAKQMDEIEPFHTFVSTGGNVLGACLYIAKAIMGANPIIFTGADFSFEGSKFHAWDSKYDNKLGRTVYLFDVFGKKVQTWQSYANFKAWFEFVCTAVPGLYINATEGGCLGSYADGNIMQIKQMDLKDVINMYTLQRHIEESCKNPMNAESKIVF